VTIRPGVLKLSWTFQRGQAPPKRENGNGPAAKRLEMFPAASSRIMKNGTPRAPGRLSVVSRWAACS
jgi:hypothetical protein